MPNSIPYEIIGLPGDLYTAPVGSAFPDIDALPGVLWTKIGLDGSLNYSPDGVKTGLSQAFNMWRSLGSPSVRKVFRTEADSKFSVEIADMTLEMVAQVMGNTVTAVPAGSGTAAYKKIGIGRGLVIPTVALLFHVPGGSPYMEDGNFMFKVPRAQYIGSPEIVWRRDNPALLAMEWMSLVDPNAASADEETGWMEAQTGATAS